MPDNNAFRGLLDTFADGSAYKQLQLPTAMQVVTSGGSAPSAAVNDPLTGKPMLFPPNASLDANMQASHDHLWNFPWFYNQVRQGGPWDYKQQDPKYHDAGNFNYGATGAAAGVPQWILDRAAGWAQKHDHPGDNYPGSWYGAAPYGDDPNSQIEINQGIAYARGKRP